MRRLPLCLGALLLFVTVLRPEEPPYKRRLQGADALKAADMARRRVALEKAGSIADALAVARELLHMRERLEGGSHWETEDERRGVESLEKLLSLDRDKQRLWSESQRLLDQAGALSGQGKYGEATPLFRHLVEVSEQFWGPRHPITGRSYNNLAVNLLHLGKYAEAEATARKALAIWEEKLGPQHPDTALAGGSLANALAAQGKTAEAEQLFRRSLDVSRQTLGPRHIQTAIGCNSLGLHLNARGSSQEAESLLRQALAIRKETFGPQHPSTAQGLNNLALALSAQGKPAAAEPLFRQALAIREQTLGPDHPDTASSYANLASCYDAQGRYAEAEALSRRALETAEKSLGLGHPETAVRCNNLALNLFEQGKYPEAEQLCRKAVSLYEQVLGPAHPETASCYQNLAAILDKQGKKAPAEALYRKAVAVQDRALGPRHRGTARAYNNLAVSLDNQGKVAEGEQLHRKALGICLRNLGPTHLLTASTCANLGFNLELQGKPKEAERFFRQALAIQEQALGASHPDTARTYLNLATNLAAQSKTEEAEKYFRSAVLSREATRLRLASRGFDRAMSAGTEPHLGLALCLAGAHKPEEAWQVAEAGMGRGLLDNLAGPDAGTNPEGLRHQQERAARLQQLDGQLLPLLSDEKVSADQQKQRDKLAAERAALLAEIDREAVAQARRRVFPFKRIQKHMAADEAIVFWADFYQLGSSPHHLAWHWACVLRSTGSPHWVRLPGRSEDRPWAEAEESLAQRFRQALARRSPEYRELAAQLRRQRLDPLAPQLGAAPGLPAVKRLLVVPVCSMSGVPLEALTDRYTISYIPSATVFARLARKHRAVEQPSLLALGDPTFQEPETPAEVPLPEHGLLVVQVLPDGPSARAGLRANDVLLDYDGTPLHTLADFKLRQHGEPATVHLWRQGKTLSREVPAGKLGLVVHKQPAPVALKEQHELHTLLASSRGPAPRPLPGTRQEVEALARLLPSERVRLLLGSQASEQQLTQLASTGKLKEYRLLHFATHGAMDPQSPTRSALLLANDRLPDPASQVRRGETVYTGRLTVGTLLGWRLDADLVTLSACETGLGRQGGGEGYLGFVQALLQVGAHSVVVSLWPVDDAATALLMMRFYENLLGRRPGLKAPLGRAESLQEARQWLRGLTRSEAEALTAQLSQGQLRVTIRPLKPLAPAAPEKEEHPYAHPYYWSAFVLLGDPD